MSWKLQRTMSWYPDLSDCRHLPAPLRTLIVRRLRWLTWRHHCQSSSSSGGRRGNVSGGNDGWIFPVRVLVLMLFVTNLVSSYLSKYQLEMWDHNISRNPYWLVKKCPPLTLQGSFSFLLPFFLLLSASCTDRFMWLPNDATFIMHWNMLCVL